MKKVVSIIISMVMFLSYILIGINIETMAQTNLVAPTEYKDWSEFTTLDINYSYSKIFYNDDTQIEIIKSDRSVDWRWVNEIGVPTVDLYEGDELILLITNCTINKKGQPLDAVIKLNNVNEWNEKSSGVRLSLCDDYKLDSQANQKGNGSGYDYKVEINRGELINFNLLAFDADCDFTITYYVAGTYKYNKENNKETGVLGEITKINGYFYDLDVPAGTRYPNEFLRGNEGFAPNVGKSTIYYNKNRYSRGKGYVHLQELDNGIANQTVYEEDGVNCNADWYQSAVFIATTDIKDSTYSFKYGGHGCGMIYKFMAPYPLTIKQEISKVKLYTADGKLINSVGMEDGKEIEDLKSAFISDGVYLITDNELIQDARVEIEYKFIVKNNGYVPCTELIIENKLDDGLTCMSENWEHDGEKVVLHIYADEGKTLIEPEEEYETTMVASKLLSSFSKEYKFENRALATDPNIGIESTSEQARSEAIKIIPPFGVQKRKNVVLIINLIVAIVIIINILKRCKR